MLKFHMLFILSGSCILRNLRTRWLIRYCSSSFTLEREMRISLSLSSPLFVNLLYYTFDKKKLLEPKNINVLYTIMFRFWCQEELLTSVSFPYIYIYTHILSSFEFTKIIRWLDEEYLIRKLLEVKYCSYFSEKKLPCHCWYGCASYYA